MEDTPEEIIEDLRELAQISADDLNEANKALASVIPGTKVAVEETTEWEAAELLLRFTKALRKIARGTDNPRQIAREALKPKSPE